MKRGILWLVVTAMLLFHSAPSLGYGIITHLGLAQKIIKKNKETLHPKQYITQVLKRYKTIVQIRKLPQR